MAASGRSPVARLIVWLVAVPVAVIVVLFALSNRDVVELALFPLPGTQSVPVFVVGLCAVVLGILAGGAISWLSGHAWRRRARQAESVQRGLEAEISGLRRQLDTARRKALESAEAALPAPGGAEHGAKSAELVETDRPH